MAAGIAILILGGLAGGSYVAYGQVKSRADRLQALLTSDLQAGQQELEAGKTSLTEANSKHDASLVAQAVAHFDAARTHFQTAGQTADSSTLLHDLELVPAAGTLAQSRHTAVDGIAAMGVALADAGKDVSDLDAQLIKPKSDGQASRTLLTVLDQTQGALSKVQADVERAQKAADSVDLSVVPSGQQATFVKAKGTISNALAGMSEFQRLVPVLRDILGGNGVRNYLIEQVNPSELRAGGGFIGTYSILRTDHGTLTLVSSGDAYALANPRPLPGQPGFIPLPMPYREVIPDTSWSFVDSNIYPDFPTNATTAETFAKPHLGLNVDGVISMDYYIVAKMLEITGPLSVPGYGLTVSSANFIQQVMQSELALDPAQKVVLGALAGRLMQSVSSLPSDRWPGLISALNELATGRHIQAYFNNQNIENEFDRIGWSGRANPAAATDYMMEIEDNYFGTKANYFLSRHFTVLLTRNGDKLHHKVVVDLVNSERYGTEDRVTYKADIRTFVSGNSTAMSDNLRAVKYADPTAPPGTSLMNGWIDVTCCGGTGHAVFEYDTPWTQVRGAHQIYWQKQPGTANDKVDVAWSDGQGHSYYASGTLNEDRTVTLSPNGVTLGTGQPAAASLPSLTLG